MRHFKTFGTFLLLAALCTQLGCSTLFGGIALGRNRSKWNGNKISGYRMTMEIKKTGHRAPDGHALVEVRDGAIVSISPTPDLGFGCGMGGCERYATVEKLFAIIEDANKQFPAELDVEYDPQYGYPKSLRLDISRQASDDELTVKILRFEAL